MELKPEFKSEFITAIKNFIQSRVKEANAKGVVIGLSGGLDSAVTAKLCVDALGNKNVLLLILPSEITREHDTNDAIELAKSWDVNYKVINISKSANSFILGKVTSKEYGNIQARVRMIFLYFFANKMGYLVAGTGNKSERLIGYFTKYGDGACDLLPIGDLYKTQIIELAKELKIPDKIINKVPSAGLWKGQTDEKELGITYKKLDGILIGFEKGLGSEKIANELALPLKEVERIRKIVASSEHKREIPPIPKLSY